MSCVGCSCDRAQPVGPGQNVWFATGVQHTLQALRATLRDRDVAFREPAAGLLLVPAAEVAVLLGVTRAALSGVEADEVRVLVADGETGDDLLLRALTAPSLSRVEARAAHADLLTLLADEPGCFRSVYQPIVRLGVDPTLPVGQDGGPTVVAHEALLRASGPQGPVMPQELFAAAEAAGWLHVLDRVGRTTALHGAAGWLGADRLFVNFLPTTIYRPEVCLATTERAAARAGLPLEQVVFEVTESERITDLDHLERVFAYYREQGCQVALDDLGAGYSSLNTLVRLQPDVVKLDKEVVQHLPGTTSRAVVEAVVSITHAYGGEVLAECVETAEQARVAADLGVDLGQGWFFGRPVEAPASTGRAAGARVPRPRAAPTAGEAAGVTGNDPAVAVPG